MAKCTGIGLVVKRPGVLSKVQMLNLVLGVGFVSPSSKLRPLQVLSIFGLGLALVSLLSGL